MRSAVQRSTLALFALALSLGVGRCDCGGDQATIDKAYCADLGLEFREKDGQGYCYKLETIAPDAVDCSTADDGDPCNDGDACTFGDHCVAATGACQGNLLTGIDDGNPCTQDSCDPETGELHFDAAAMDGEACDDGDVCSNNDSCQQGRCVGDYSVDSSGQSIDDGDACTRDFCDASGARVNLQYSATEAAALGLGGITPEQLSNPCLAYTCVVGTGDTPHMANLDGQDCSDPAAGRSAGNCLSWTCESGLCSAQINEEDLQNASVTGGLDLAEACRQRECDSSTGNVVYVVNPSRVGEPCDDDNSCSYDDACTLSGSCEGRELPHGTLCDDGNACTTGDYCHIETCRPGVDYLALANSVADPLAPDPMDSFRDPEGIISAGDSCKSYTCDPVRGVVVSAVNDGSSCDDENPCTETSTCQQGQCVGERNDHNDGIPCPNGQNLCEEGYCDKGVCVNPQPVTDARSCTGTDPCKLYHCQDVGGVGSCEISGNVLNSPAVTCGAESQCVVSFCVDGNCTSNTSARDGSPCSGEGQVFDPRCNAPTCNSSICLANPAADGTECTLTADDVGSTDLACNTGVCRNISGIGYCQPQSVADDTNCDNHNPCDGADWCRDFGGIGRCVERYTSDDPSDPAPPSSECSADPAQCYDNMAPVASTAQPCEVDGDPATVGRCRYDGQCLEISQVVDDNNGCTTATFNDVTGQVEQQLKANGTECHVININPCIENLGICIDGTCETNPIPDGTACDLAGQAVAAAEDLPAGQRPECFAEVCLGGQCVIDSTVRNGSACDDGETTCTQAGECRSGQCAENSSPRGYGETCSAPEASNLVDLQGQPIAPKDAQCWAAFECAEDGRCAVAVAAKPNGQSCDYTLDGDNCDGWCQSGKCEVHLWDPIDELSCDDGEVCTRDQCDSVGGCQHTAYPDVARQGCQGVDPANACRSLQCQSGHCTALNSDFNFCDDQNPCTVGDHCNSGVCQPSGNAPAGFACGSSDDDDDCVRQVCNSNGSCSDQVNESDGSFCNINEFCSLWTCQSGQCVNPGNNGRPDGTNCDTNNIPCDEACLDLDGPLGPEPSACRDFATFGALLNAKRMANGNLANSATDSEELACRSLYDPTFDPEASNPEASGHRCARWTCYYGACRSWDSQELPAGLLSSTANDYGGTVALPRNPSDGRSCAASDACTTYGRCLDSVCQSYNQLPDGTRCGDQNQCDDGDFVFASSCEAGACTDRRSLVGRCSAGISTCQASHCEGQDCSHRCHSSSYDLLNVFEDISASGDPQRARLRSPIAPQQICGDVVAGALSEERRLACDDGSVLMDLQNDLGFGQSAGEGYWFFNRRYRYLSISANGTVLLHKDHPANLSESDDTLFITGDVGGHVAIPDNDGESAAQIRVFRDDLSLVSDIDVPRTDIPQDPTQPYGSFVSLGEIYTKHMPGPDGLPGDQDDYLIIQWNNVAFFGCAQAFGDRAHMTFQLKWWPATGMLTFVYPWGRNSDGPDVEGCLPGRVNGADAVIGLVDENGSPARDIASNSWAFVNDSGPLSDPFDAYFMMWPKNRPITQYALRGVEWFDDISAYDDRTGERVGQRLNEVSDCDDCCERVDLDPPVFVRGQAKTAIYVCSDGLVKFVDAKLPTNPAVSPNNSGQSLITDLDQDDVFAPFWTTLRPAANNVGGIYWQDKTGLNGRELVVQWSRVDYAARSHLHGGLFPWEQELGEAQCSDNSDNDNDGTVDCDDVSCGCAEACGGIGCGLSFELIYHDGLNIVEFRYMDKFQSYLHANASATAAVGVSRNIDLYDQLSGGDTIPGGPLLGPWFDSADVDEFRPGEQRNVIIPLSGTLTSRDR